MLWPEVASILDWNLTDTEIDLLENWCLIAKNDLFEVNVMMGMPIEDFLQTSIGLAGKSIGYVIT